MKMEFAVLLNCTTAFLFVLTIAQRERGRGSLSAHMLRRLADGIKSKEIKS